MRNGNLKLAVQKKGRLSERTVQLIRSCGIDVDNYQDRLFFTARNYKIDLLFVRDDDIPEYVQDGVADIGIVGEDIIFEKKTNIKEIKKLGFGKCKLMIAIPEKDELENLNDIVGKTIATSYPNILSNFLRENNIDAKIIEISGSVEIAPSLGVANYICDLVSTGNTLKLNKLKKSFTVFESEAALISNDNVEKDEVKGKLLNDLIIRIDSALTAKRSKYLMMNVPRTSLEEVVNKIPSLKSPTILPLADENMLAVHAVIPSETFWKINNDLKNAGASGILLLPIENMII